MPCEVLCESECPPESSAKTEPPLRSSSTLGDGPVTVFGAHDRFLRANPALPPLGAMTSPRRARGLSRLCPL
jgi:hypothetical protein